MIESELLAEGSERGILLGTNYNRCKRLHVVAALSFKLLHFKSFLLKYKESCDDESRLYCNEIIEILENDNHNPQNSEQTLKLLQRILQDYNAYAQKTLNGEHGRTPQFVLMYARFVDFFKLFEFAIRCSDIDLYIYVAHKMCALFFGLNHQNYARWLTRNLDDFMNIENTHPGLLEDFKNGALSIRRTSKNFCRSAVDLTLEQTINADAANKLKGVTAYTNSLCARQRWSETHTIRTAIITKVLESLHLDKTPEKYEGPYQSKIFNQQLQKFSNAVSENINPFSDGINPTKLFNLKSGKAAANETADFLLNVERQGIQQMKAFIKGCQEDGSRFEKPIKKNVIQNFAAEKSKNKHAPSNRINETKLERNILGNVLCLAMNNNIELKDIFSYPLATIPHTFAHFDHFMSNKSKGELTALLDSKHMYKDVSKPDDINVEIIDGFYLLSGLKDAPVKFGHLAIHLLKKVCNTGAHEIHLMFDHHERSSLRDTDIRYISILTYR